MNIFNIYTTPIYSPSFTARKSVSNPIKTNKADTFNSSCNGTESAQKRTAQIADLCLPFAKTAEVKKEYEKNLNLLSDSTFDKFYNTAKKDKPNELEDKLKALSLCKYTDKTGEHINEKRFNDLLNMPIYFWQGTIYEMRRLFDKLQIKDLFDEQTKNIDENAVSIFREEKNIYTHILSEIMDDESIKKLLQEEPQTITKYAQKGKELDISHLIALKKLTSKNPKGEGLKYFDLICAYKKNQLPLPSIPEEGLSVEELQIPLFENIIKGAKKSEKEILTHLDQSLLDKIKERNVVGLESLYLDGKANARFLLPILGALPDELYQKFEERFKENHAFRKVISVCVQPKDGQMVLYDNTLACYLDLPDSITKLTLPKLTWLTQNGFEKAYELSVDQLKKMVEHPEFYINGNVEDKQKAQRKICNFFENNIDAIMMLSAVIDKESLDSLFRLRLEDAAEYLKIVRNFTFGDIKALSALMKLNDNKTKGHEYIELIQAYKNFGMELDPKKIENFKNERMEKDPDNTLDWLRVYLFKTIMFNLADIPLKEINQISNEKILSWDLKYIHWILYEMIESNDSTLKDILHTAIMEPNFIDYIENPENKYGHTNATTKSMFKENGLNYDKWLKPNKDNKIRFVAQDANNELMSQIATQITEDMNVLIKGPLNSLLKKQIPQFIIKDEFVIPKKYLTSKAKLKELLTILTDTSEKGQLAASVWNRAEKNKSIPQYAVRAKNTLTILDHLKQRKKDLEQAPDFVEEETIDWTIKMWDRVPQKDLFQGNYSTCCIGMGHGNGDAMPYYLVSTAFNMIELVDNNTGRTIGNSLCYFVIKDNKPTLILDNIEINNAFKTSDKVGKKIREQITNYAKSIAKDVTGNNNIPIYLGNAFNDIPTNDLSKETPEVSFIGDIDCKEIYLDAYGGWTVNNGATENKRRYSKTNLLRLA